MKITKQTNKPKFTPFTISIEVNTEEEYALLWNMSTATTTIPNLFSPSSERKQAAIMFLHNLHQALVK